MSIPTRFATRLRTLRERRGMTQADLAREAGVAPAQLSRYEVGKTTPRHEVVCRLAEALGVTLNDFFPPDDFQITITLTADLYEALKRDAKVMDATIEDAAKTRLLSAFFPREEYEAEREQWEYMESVINALEATSEDFERELGERMAKHLATIRKKPKD